MIPDVLASGGFKVVDMHLLEDFPGESVYVAKHVWRNYEHAYPLL